MNHGSDLQEQGILHPMTIPRVIGEYHFADLSVLPVTTLHGPLDKSKIRGSIVSIGNHSEQKQQTDGRADPDDHHHHHSKEPGFGERGMVIVV